MLYEKPVWRLMSDAAQELEPPFSAGDIRSWFAEDCPLVRPTTVDLHIEGLAANHPRRPGHTNLRKKPPVLFLREDGLYEPYDAGRHGPYTDYSAPQPDETDAQPTDLTPQPVSQDEAKLGDWQAGPSPKVEFALESYLDGFIRTNWSRINWQRNLRIWTDPTGVIGCQYPTVAGRLDFLCVDVEKGCFVVIELKRGRPLDEAVGQIMRYMGWVEENLASQGQGVEGIIVAHEIDDHLIYSARAVLGLSLMRYEIDFRLIPRE